MQVIESVVWNKCDVCNKEDVVTSFLEGISEDTVLCDECLQELNRKIVEHLAEKNL